MLRISRETAEFRTYRGATPGRSTAVAATSGCSPPHTARARGREGSRRLRWRWSSAKLNTVEQNVHFLCRTVVTAVPAVKMRRRVQAEAATGGTSVHDIDMASTHA